MAEDREKARQRQARYRERHRDRIRDQMRARYATAEHRAYMARKHSEERFGGLREAVLARDGHRCRECGFPWQPGSRRIVVHHIDGDKSHNTMANLITLCRACHPRTHGPLSEEHRRKIAESNRANPALHRPHGPHSPEHRAKIAAANRGKRRAQEFRDRCREATRQQWAALTPEQKAARLAPLIEARRRRG